MERGWKPNVEVSPACPRCGSSNTKFCYYNNYSLTQPRYFCKGCRRYWTKGGSLRNVPIGGGCRKTRRGKSIRVSSTDGAAVNSRNLAHNRIESSSSISEASTSIDLAAVYANFLNLVPRAENNQIEALSQLPDGIENIPSIEFSNFQSLHMNQLITSHLPQENNRFFECETFPARLSGTQLFGPGGGNSMFLGGLDGFQKHQFTTGNSFNSLNPMDNDILPPLPGEEVAVSEGMLWPSGDVILPNQILPSTQEIQPEEEQNSGLLNGNVSPFGGLNLEAIFRS